MPKIPILKPPYKNVDEVALLEGGADLIDGYFDETGALNRRWGLWSWWSSGHLNGCDGIFWWKDKQQLIAVFGGQAYAFTSLTTAPTEITSPNCRLLINEPVSFATSGSLLFMANKGRIVIWDGVNPASFCNDPLAPVQCAGVTVFQNRLIAPDYKTQIVRFTEFIDEADTTITFKPAYFQAGSNSDVIYQVASGWSELMLIGPYSTEVWYFTGEEETETDVPFARIEGAAIERGLNAPASVLLAGNTWYWLDNERRIIKLNGRSPQVISLPIDRLLRGYKRTDDCRSFLVDRWIAFAFPEIGITWAFDQITEQWTRWAKWNQDSGQYEAYWGQCSVYVPEWNTIFLGGRKEGRILITHPNLQTDIYEPIRMKYLSAHFDHGTMARKKSNRLLIRLKRGS